MKVPIHLVVQMNHEGKIVEVLGVALSEYEATTIQSMRKVCPHCRCITRIFTRDFEV